LSKTSHQIIVEKIKEEFMKNEENIEKKLKKDEKERKFNGENIKFDQFISNNTEEINKIVVNLTENEGIVFIDEIDKICIGGSRFSSVSGNIQIIQFRCWCSKRFIAHNRRLFNKDRLWYG
jgi:ATP-dependent protease HslVU (ClpYQ) ATPase subunit